MPSTDLMVCVPKDIVDEILDEIKELTQVWEKTEDGYKIFKQNEISAKYQLNTFKINGTHHKIKSDLKGYLCEPFDPNNKDHQTTTEIYNECSKYNDNELICEASSKCEWKDSKCDYKNISNDDIKKYSIMNIYK